MDEDKERYELFAKLACESVYSVDEVQGMFADLIYRGMDVAEAVDFLRKHGATRTAIVLAGMRFIGAPWLTVPHG